MTVTRRPSPAHFHERDCSLEDLVALTEQSTRIDD
jgi:hypothetical protein